MKLRPITTIKTIVEKIEDGGADIKLFSLVDPDRWELPPFRPGAHIDLHLPGGLVRTYSLCNDPADNRRYLVAVKRERNGRGGSAKLHDEVKVGDVIGVSLPRGGLDLDKDVMHFAFVAGGIGVTPFLSAASLLMRTGRAHFTLHLVARGEPPLQALLASFMKSGNVFIYDTLRSGRPDIASLIGNPTPHQAVGCCGPGSMIDDFEQATRDWPNQRVHVERFVPSVLPVDPNAKPYTIALSRSRLEMRVEPGQTMLEALVSLGIDIPASCCGGICGSCKVDWLEGTPVHRDRVLSPSERERSLMVCVSGSAEDRLVLDL
jgi:vanillate O-demethylase ferredoxin subunit